MLGEDGSSDARNISERSARRTLLRVFADSVVEPPGLALRGDPVSRLADEAIEEVTLHTR